MFKQIAYFSFNKIGYHSRGQIGFDFLKALKSMGAGFKKSKSKAFATRANKDNH